MLLSQTAEYALRAVVCLARTPQQQYTTQQIADATQVPSGYLSKVLQDLRRARIVHAQRGLHGGFSLARPSDQVSVLDVVNAVATVDRIHTCPLGIASHGVNLCPLHRKLDDAMAMIQEAFATTPIADLLHGPSASQPLGDMHIRGQSLPLPVRPQETAP